MTIKLIAVDLDGTVVKHDLSIAEAVITALKRAEQEFGCKVIIATGRMFPSTISFSQRVGLNNPVVAYQGAMVRDLSEAKETIADYPMLYHQGLSADVVQQLLALAQQNSFHTNLYVNDVLYTNEMNEKAWYYKSITGVTPVLEPDLTSVLNKAPDGQASKIMVIDEQCEQVAETFKQALGGQISVCISRQDFCEIVHPNVSKWNAIEHIMQRWGIKPEEVMCIGDQENDLSMISAAGIGVAMGNAPQHVKDTADFVTTSIDEDGVVRALEEFVFNYSEVNIL